MKNKLKMIAVVSASLALFSVNCLADNAHHVDNSARNSVDQNMDTVLPEDQSNEKVFLERTAAIRRDIVASKDLSVEAKNVKIVTLASGDVVLRGPVTTTEEKDFIESAAKRHSGNAVVKSFLEVM